MKQLLVDLDGVVTQYDFPKLLRKYFDVSIKSEDIYAYSIEDVLGVSAKDISMMFAKEVFSPPRFIKGALDALEYFTTEDFDVGIYSNRIQYTKVEGLRDWLEKYKIPFTSIITEQTLPSYIHAFVDDSPAKLMLVDDAVRVKNLLLFSQPWNKKCLNIKGRIRRISGWKEIKELIDGGGGE